MYTFGGVTATAMLILGQIINLSGGVFYTYEKYRLNVMQSIAPSPSTTVLANDLKSDSDLHKLAQVKIENNTTSRGENHFLSKKSMDLQDFYKNNERRSENS